MSPTRRGRANTLAILLALCAGAKSLAAQSFPPPGTGLLVFSLSSSSAFFPARGRITETGFVILGVIAAMIAVLLLIALCVVLAVGTQRIALSVARFESTRRGD